MKKNSFNKITTSLFFILFFFSQAYASVPPTFQTTGTVVSGTGNITPAWPIHQTGDVALLIVETDTNQDVTLSSNTANFVQISNSPQNASGTKLTVFWTRATSSSMANPTVVDSGNHQIAQIITFRGVITSGNPWDVTAGNTSNSNTTFTIPGATTTLANTLVVAIVANGTDTNTAQTSGWSNGNLTNLTERTDVNTQSNNGGGFGVATGIKTTAGSYGNTTGTLANASTQARISLALKPTLPTINISDANLTEGNTSYSNMNFKVTISESTNASVQYATADGTATAGSDYNATSGTLIFRTTDTNLTKIISVPIVGDQIIENNETFTVTLSNEVNATLGTSTATGTIINDDISYCQSNSLSTGFYVVNPFNDVNKSIEIFCYNNRDFIALPNKNSSNNFVFNTNSLVTTNYYKEADVNGTHFQAIEINANTLDVIVDPLLPAPQTVNSTFSTMGSSFSNINLTATPFAIDWDNTTISNCTQSKLRTAYYGQDVKINSLDYDSKAICNINKMKLKLLDDYRYLEYEGSEVLKKSCKTMAEAVPTSFLASSSIQGHYWISPSSNTRSYNSTDITSASRPIVAYCWYQTDLNWVWTFSLAMDGKVTNKKSDLVNKADTCSKFGLFPFVPNNEDTFDRVRAFLTAKKSQWVNYTGTNNEKFRMFNNNSNYYLSTEYNGIIWPYGSFGVYFPYAGDHTKNNVSQEWGGSNTADPGPMSGSPMHNISTITTDYDRVSNDGGDANRDYYSWGINRTELDITATQAAYSNIDTTLTDGSYTYASTMGAKGWVSILGSADLNKTDEWFISRTGAGVNFDHSSSAHPYYEPNGNYTAGAWLNFLFDSVGRVRHLDDLDAAYSYYDYMCMAEDNYDFTTRYTLVAGPFKAIEHSVASGSEASNTNITTKIVNDSLLLDIAIFNDELTALAPDRNVSVGIFMDDTYMVGSTETARDTYYFGDIKRSGTGTFNALKSTGRFQLPASAWPSGTSKWTKANKRLFVKFKYCSLDTQEWTDCWTRSGNTATCTSGKESYCKSVDSNDFAVRPNKFDFTITGTAPYKAGKPYDITFYAKDYNNNAAQDYNVSAPFTYAETKTGCLTGDYNTSITSVPLTNGSATLNLAYSEAGVINVKMEETSGSEFAVIDASDTSDTQRYITPYDQNWTYTPDHFYLASSTFTNYQNGNFTYISDNLNMFSELNVTIVAQKLDNNTTKNYNSACYAKATDYNISYDSLTIYPADSLTKIKFTETNTSTTGSSLINTKLTINDVNKTIFGTDNNGTGKLHFKLNFDRNITKPSNPLKLTFRDLNVTDEDTIKGSSDINQSALFYYGRVYSTDYRAPTDINTTIRYEVYCKDCNKTAIGITGTQSPLSLYWYQNPLHVIADGNVTAFSSATTGAKATTIANSTVSTINANTGSDTTHTLTNANAPYKDIIQMTPSTWLLYNLSNATATTNDFNVEFIRSGNWSGAGNVDRNDNSHATGAFTNDTNITRTNRKMNW
jgi:hypothetical protein